MDSDEIESSGEEIVVVIKLIQNFSRQNEKVEGRGGMEIQISFIDDCYIKGYKT